MRIVISPLLEKQIPHTKGCHLLRWPFRASRSIPRLVKNNKKTITMKLLVVNGSGYRCLLPFVQNRHWVVGVRYDVWFSEWERIVGDNRKFQRCSQRERKAGRESVILENRTLASSPWFYHCSSLFNDVPTVVKSTIHQLDEHTCTRTRATTTTMSSFFIYMLKQANFSSACH